MIEKILFYFPVVMAAGDLVAAVCYLYIKDYMRAGYWLSAMAITLFTLGMK